jgi:hypothetical protein
MDKELDTPSIRNGAWMNALRMISKAIKLRGRVYDLGVF